jgi:hypothetical protein
MLKDKPDVPFKLTSPVKIMKAASVNMKNDFLAKHLSDQQQDGLSEKATIRCMMDVKNFDAPVGQAQPKQFKDCRNIHCGLFWK